VNPKVEGAGEPYPFRELCGGAVAFKLAWGVCQAVTGAERVRDDLRAFLVDAMAYVAIATVCDVVPLVDENRVLARFGLRALQATRDPGLAALLTVCGLAGRELTAEDVAFQVGPRINASGRLGSAECALRCLLATGEDEGLRHAQELDRLNLERRSIERELAEEALLAAERFADPERWPVLVVAGEGWHQGVVGIVASRLVERFERPALVIGLDGAEGRGSARSIEGFDVLAALHGGAEHMLRYGGHAQAAGCEVRADAVDALREAVCARARELRGDAPAAARALAIDAELRFEDVTDTLLRELDRLGPWGQANEKPVFVSRDLRLAEPPRVVGADGTHLILHLRRGEHVLKALAFGMAHRVDELALGAPIDAVFTPRWNTFRGRTTLELELADFRAGEPEAGVRPR
jgi:single-stranded-DNA-specific exonuclease